MRICKRLSELGHCSRREGEVLIERGCVFVNGVRVVHPSLQVLDSDKIEIRGRGLHWLSSQVTVMLNKPVGYLSSPSHGSGYRLAQELIKPERSFHRLSAKDIAPQGLSPVGRLDIDSKGLLILTQNGALAKAIIGENSPIEKEYLVWYSGKMSSEALKLLRFGLTLDQKELRPATVEHLGEGHLQMVLREGRNRQIRRMLELVGLRVTGIKRVRIGALHLGSLPEGSWRPLTDLEVRRFRDASPKENRFL